MKDGRTGIRMLFISNNDIEDALTGGAKASRRNCEILKRYGETDVLIVRKKSNLASMVSAFQGYFPPVSKSDLQTLKNMLKERAYDLVFFDSSCFGGMVQYVRNQGISTVCFFQNCEYDYIEVRFGQKGSLKKSIYKRLIKKQEKLSACCAGQKIAFTRRDAERISQLYSVEQPRVIPLSLPDAYEVRQRGRAEKECLLFGPLGQANEEAFGWFVKNVSPHLHCVTRVAGRGFEEYGEKWAGAKVQVQGYVEDVAQLYADAACVAIPLLSGSGMKIKTAEAMMFGKYIFGTDEAFAGYELDWGRAGGRCNYAEEFIRSINSFLDSGTDPFNDYCRQAYLEKYSAGAGEKAFGAVLCAGK